MSNDGVGFRSERGPILLAIMMTTGLVAIDSTILATAVPTIVREVGGFASFPWLFSVYLLTQAVAVPIYSKLADSVGRKPVVLIGVGLFLLGSVLCGFAWSMPALIAFRAVQGLGAGAIQPMAMTIAGDIYTVAERARTQGYIASVWAVSSIVGPTLGGVFSEFVSWRWIFFVNVPLCLVAGWLLVRHLHETVARTRHAIDWLGGSFLTVSLSLLVLAILEGGSAWSWTSAPSITAFVVGATLLIGFVIVERRVVEPVLPLWMLSRRIVLTTSLLSVAVGAILIGLTSYVPSYLEALLHVSPLTSGLTLAALTIGWPLAATLSGNLYLRIGFRSTVLLGSGVTVLGTIVLAATAAHPSLVAVGLGCFVVGLGLGLVAPPSLIAAQSSVAWGERAVVTGTNMFARSVGSAVGVAALGALVNGMMHGSDAISDPARFHAAVTWIFVALAAAALTLVAAGLAMPHETTEVRDHPTPASGAATDDDALLVPALDLPGVSQHSTLG